MKQPKEVETMDEGGHEIPALKAGKRRMAMVNPSGEDREETAEPASEEAEETTGAEAAEQEAGTIMDEIADSPEVCHALYQMLKEKYSDEKPTKPTKIPAKEKDDSKEYNMEGMD